MSTRRGAGGLPSSDRDLSARQASAGALRARNLRTIGALAALFLLPIAISFWLYYGIGWRPAAHLNHGELLQPARILPSVRLTGPNGVASTATVFAKRWALVYVGDGRCDSACRYALYVMRETQLALNHDMPRVERVFLATADCCDDALLAREDAGMIVLDASSSPAQELIRSFPSADRPSTIFVVDPLGNLMMRYDSRRDPRGLLLDLQVLLRLSHIG
ncbi:MAG TPA: SCO family protein [Steroidobacteraceae bacterium]|nr:SCO family protein [Steroidobacteraceae bacterium]